MSCCVLPAPGVLQLHSCMRRVRPARPAPTGFRRTPWVGRLVLRLLRVLWSLVEACERRESQQHQPPTRLSASDDPAPVFRLPQLRILACSLPNLSCAGRHLAGLPPDCQLWPEPAGCDHLGTRPPPLKRAERAKL